MPDATGELGTRPEAHEVEQELRDLLRGEVPQQLVAIGRGEAARVAEERMREPERGLLVRFERDRVEVVEVRHHRLVEAAVDRRVEPQVPADGAVRFASAVDADELPRDEIDLAGIGDVHEGEHRPAEVGGDVAQPDRSAVDDRRARLAAHVTLPAASRMFARWVVSKKPQL